MNIVTKMKHDWDRRAKHHARYWIATEDYQNEEIFEQSGQVTADAILATLGPYHRSSSTVLDIGCGIGRVLKPLASHFRHLIGIDVSAEMISKSKAWLHGIRNVTTFETSGVDLSLFPPRHFDLVYSYVAFQHMPRPVFDRYLEEINRVLKTQGMLVFQIPIGSHQDAPIEDTIAVRFYEIDVLQDKLKRNGFQLLESQDREPSSSPSITQNCGFHQFFLAQKVETIRPEINVGWLETECREHSSFLDTRMYLTFAERCLHQGQPDKAIHTYKYLLGHDSSSLEAWLQLAAVLIDCGKLDQAISTLTDLTRAHPTYLDGHRTLKELLQQYRRIKKAMSPSA